MAEWTVVVKNVSGNFNWLSDFGIQVPSGGQITLTDVASYELIGGSKDLKQKIVDDVFIINDGSKDLDKWDSLDFVTLENVEDVEKEKDLLTVGASQTYSTSAGLFFGDGDTGFYEASDDSLHVRFGGSDTTLWAATQFRYLTSSGYNLRSVGADNPCYSFSDNYWTGMGQTEFDNITFWTSGVAAVSIDEYQNVGIGTSTNLTRRLTIDNDSWDSHFEIRRDGNRALTLTGDVNQAGYIISPNNLYMNAGGNQYFAFYTTGRFSLGSSFTPNSTVHIIGSNSSDVTLKLQASSGQSGNLQNWIDNSGNTLNYIDVNGRLVLDASTLYSPTSGGVWFGDSDTGIYESQNNYLVFTIGGTDYFRARVNALQSLTSRSWNLLHNGDGYTDPCYSFTDNPGTGIGQGEYYTFSLIANSTEVARILSGGVYFIENVGIGVENPTSKLYIDNSETNQITLKMELTRGGLPEPPYIHFDNDHSVSPANPVITLNRWSGTATSYYASQLVGSNLGLIFATTAVATDIGSQTIEDRMIVSKDGYVGINEINSLGAQLHVNTSASSIIGQIIRGSASQSANLTEWQNSSSTVLTCIDEAGKIGIGTNNPAAPLTVYASASHIQLYDTSDGQRGLLHVDNGYMQMGNWSSSSGRVAIKFSTGAFGVGTSNPGGKMEVEGSDTSQVTLVLKAEAAQSADIQQWQDSSATVLSCVTSGGYFGIGTDTPAYPLTINRTDSGDAAQTIVFQENDTDWAWLGWNPLYNRFDLQTNGNNQRIQFNSANGMVVYGTVGVGIGGIVTPTESLEVSGNIWLSGDITYSGTQSLTGTLGDIETALDTILGA